MEKLFVGMVFQLDLGRFKCIMMVIGCAMVVMVVAAVAERGKTGGDDNGGDE